MNRLPEYKELLTREACLRTYALEAFLQDDMNRYEMYIDLAEDLQRKAENIRGEMMKEWAK